jgi:hypothetical protein
VYTIFALHSLTYTLSPHPAHFHWYQLSLSLTHTHTHTHRERTFATLLFSTFLKEKIKDFSLFKIDIEGVSLWHFHACVLCITNWIGSSPLHFFFLSWSISYGDFNRIKIPYLFMYTEYINHIPCLNFLFLPSPSHMWPTFSVTCFS